MNITLPTRIPQNDDSEAMLLARMIGVPQRGTLLASAVRSATTSSAEIELYGCKGVIVFLNISAASGTGGLFVYPEHQDPVTGVWSRFWNYPAAARTTTGLLMVQCGPGIGTQASGSFTGLGILSTLVGKMRFTITHGDATNYTYSLGYELIP